MGTGAEKDINIYVDIGGTETVKQKIDDVAQAGKQLNTGLAEGQTTAAAGTDKLTEKHTGLDRVLGRVRNQVYGLVAGWLGINGVLRLIDMVIARMEKMNQLQGEIYDKSIPLLNLGQSLEAATGTAGTQQGWTQKMLGLQKAGGLASPEIARDMMLAANVAYGGAGGIENKAVMDMLSKVAPFAGMHGLSADQAAELVKFGGGAGVPAEPEAWMKFLTQLQAGFKSSKASTFGEYLSGAQKSLTGYLGTGGTLEKGIGFYAAAGAAPGSDAGVSLEQITKLITELPQKSQRAIERSTGAKWGALSTDQKMDTFLRYIGGLSPELRQRTLKKWGFPEEAGRFAGTPPPFAISPQTEAGLPEEMATIAEGPAAKEAAAQAETALKKVKTASKFMSWIRRRKAATDEFQIQQAQGLDSVLVPDRAEIDIIALQSLLTDYNNLIGSLPKGPERATAMQVRDALLKRMTSRGRMGWDVYLGDYAKVGVQFNRDLETLEAGTRPVNIYNDNSYNVNPVIGSRRERRIGPRSAPEDTP